MALRDVENRAGVSRIARVESDFFALLPFGQHIGMLREEVVRRCRLIYLAPHRRYRSWLMFRSGERWNKFMLKSIPEFMRLAVSRLCLSFCRDSTAAT